MVQHAVHAEREGDGHYCRQAFGNRRDGQCDGGHRRLYQRVTAQQAEDEHQRHDAAGDHCEAFAQAVKLLLQRRLALDGGGEQPGKTAHFGAHAGGGDDGFEAAARHHGVHEHHVVPFRQRRLFINSVRQLGDRLRFAGQGSLRHLSAVRRQHAGVGRNAVAGLKQQDVPRHQIGRLDQANLAVASHARRRREHVLQRRQSRFGTMLLKEAQHRVEQHHHGNDDRVLEIADRAGQDCSSEQDEDQQAPELIKELAPGRAGRLFREPVGTMPGKALLGNVCGQTTRRV